MISVTLYALTFGVAIVVVVAGAAMIYLKLNELHKQMNSRLDELVSVTRVQALAEGRLAGEQEQKTRPGGQE